MRAAADLFVVWLVLSGSALVVLGLIGLAGEWWRGRRTPDTGTSAGPVVPCPLLGTQRAVRHAMTYHEWGDDLPTPLVGGKSAIRGKSIEEIAHKLIVQTGGRTW